MTARARPRRHNLPAELTSFIGRREELSEIRRLLTTTRLLTLTGSGGAGKTRLALRAAVGMVRAFPDGVWLVPLAPIEDALLVTQAVFKALGLQDVSARWSLSTLSDYLGSRQALLVFDNCEHLLDACAVLVSTLLKACPDLQVLATSREPIGIPGELRMRVPPLAQPEAIALLTERAAVVLPGFTVDRSNAEAAERLCRRLDRIPLALELAAVRLEGLTLEQLVAGLERDLPVFTGRNRGAEARQQTLEATIGWSYRLLGVEERLLWARLSAFAGGFDELAATEVCAFSGLVPEQIPELIASLVEKSIVQRDPSVRPPRLSMLEIVRQYGRRRLQEVGEEADVLGRHRDWILGLATKAAAYDDARVDAHRRMGLERDNLFSALDFCLRTGQAEAGIDICALNVDYWLGHGPLREVRRILSSFEAITQENSVARARAMTVGALLAVTQADVAVAESMARESLSIGQRLGDSEVVCWAAGALLFAGLARGSSEDVGGLVQSMIDHARSSQWWAEPIALNYLGMIRLAEGDTAAAVRAGSDALQLCRTRGEQWIRGNVLNTLAEARRRQGELDAAEALAREGVECKDAMRDRRGLASLVETRACLAADRGGVEASATMLGAAAKLRESVAAELLPPYVERHRFVEDSVRARLSEATFARAFDRGRAMSEWDVIDFVLERPRATIPLPRARREAAGLGVPLTRREMEIARLIEDDLSNREIASKLFISERTVETHITNMLNKLGVNSRRQIVSATRR